MDEDSKPSKSVSTNGHHEGLPKPAELEAHAPFPTSKTEATELAKAVVPDGQLPGEATSEGSTSTSSKSSRRAKRPSSSTSDDDAPMASAPIAPAVAKKVKAAANGAAKAVSAAVSMVKQEAVTQGSSRVSSPAGTSANGRDNSDSDLSDQSDDDDDDGSDAAPLATKAKPRQSKASAAPAKSKAAKAKARKKGSDDDDEDTDMPDAASDDDEADSDASKSKAKGSKGKGKAKAAAPKKAAASKKGKGKAKAESEDEEKPKAKAKAKGKKGKKEGTEDPEAAAGETEEYQWWLDQDKMDTSIKWKTLQHAGVLFPPEYEPLPANIKMKYNGKSYSSGRLRLLCLYTVAGKAISLPPESEEVMTYFAAMKETDHAAKPVFVENFFNDFKDMLAEHPPVSRQIFACLATY